MKPIIRLAATAELATVQDLNRALFVSDEPYDGDINLSWPHTRGRAYFKGAIAGKTGLCLVAEMDGRIVGYLVGAVHQDTPDYRPVAVSELENMFVLADYRSQGIGTLLVERFKEWSRAQGVQACQVSAYAGNERAQAFYRRMGYADYAVTLESRLD